MNTELSYLERNYTKIKLEVYTELRRRLNNKCGVSCPLSILISERMEKSTKSKKEWFYDGLFCEKGCDREFGYVLKPINPINNSAGGICPCDRVIDLEELFLALDE